MQFLHVAGKLISPAGRGLVTRIRLTSARPVRLLGAHVAMPSSSFAHQMELVVSICCFQTFSRTMCRICRNVCDLAKMADGKPQFVPHCNAVVLFSCALTIQSGSRVLLRTVRDTAMASIKQLCNALRHPAIHFHYANELSSCAIFDGERGRRSLGLRCAPVHLRHHFIVHLLARGLSPVVACRVLRPGFIRCRRTRSLLMDAYARLRLTAGRAGLK